MEINLTIPDFSPGHTLVVGDLMLDRYWSGGAERISPEAPVPVVHVKEIEERPGGAGNVALNIAALGGKVTLLGIVGTDAEGDVLQGLLERRGVQCQFQREPEIRTATKLRVLSRHQQLIRLDFEERLESISFDTLMASFKALLPSCGAVVLSDYGKGTLGEVQQLIQLAREAGKKVLVDPKGTDFSKYRGASLMTPNLSEFEAVAGKGGESDTIVERGEQLRQQLEMESLLVTRGESGMTLLEQGNPPFHQPTHAREVYDVTGAGDTVIATLAAGLASGIGCRHAVTIANLAAGIVVGKLGTSTTSVAELHHAAHDPEMSGFGILYDDALLTAIGSAQVRGEKVIMTNGCFDLLHPGHVAYLAEARRLGDRLVVAVNSDESVRQLKGEGRPINGLESRMTLLAALESVDWVVSFSEETPERLYCKLLPDVIVKGGDYSPEEVAGGPCVVANGGSVEILKFVEGHSTTSIVEKIKEKT